MNRDFLFYLENLETLKPKKFTKSVEILQLSPGTHYTSSIHRHHFINLYTVFHPDKVRDADKLKAKACFDLIYSAVRQFAAIKSKPAVTLEDLIEELFPVTAGKAMLSSRDSFEKLYNELISPPPVGAVGSAQPAVGQKIEQQQKRRLFSILKAKASTPEEMVKLLKFQSEKFGESSHPGNSILLQRATNAGNPQAVLMTSHYILLGHYGLKPEQIAWAMHSINYIDNLLKQDSSGQNINVLDDFKDVSKSLQTQVDIVIPSIIPEDCKELIAQMQLKISKIKRSSLLTSPVLMDVVHLCPLIKSNFEGSFPQKETTSFLGSILGLFGSSPAKVAKQNSDCSASAGTSSESSLSSDLDEDYIVVESSSQEDVICTPGG